VNVGSWLLWGLVATILLTAILAGCQGARLTRMSLPILLGTMLTPNRERATRLGTVFHLVNGLIFAALYLAAFHAWGVATWWAGAAIGLVHAATVLTAGMQLLPSIHPRMASEHQGPTVVRQLEPPGFLALHYGRNTPLSVLVAHLAFGAVLGGFYRL
jgi:hypothetical protein